MQTQPARRCEFSTNPRPASTSTTSRSCSPYSTPSPTEVTPWCAVPAAPHEERASSRRTSGRPSREPGPRGESHPRHERAGVGDVLRRAAGAGARGLAGWRDHSCAELLLSKSCAPCAGSWSSSSAGGPGGSPARWGEGAEFTSAPRGGRKTSPHEIVRACEGFFFTRSERRGLQPEGRTPLQAKRLRGRPGGSPGQPAGDHRAGRQGRAGDGHRRAQPARSS